MGCNPQRSRLNRRWWCVSRLDGRRNNGCRNNGRRNNDRFDRRFRRSGKFNQGNAIRRTIDPMRASVVFPLRALFGLILAIAWLSVLAPGDDGPQHWVTTWTTANADSDQPTVFSNQTIPEIVHTTIGGSAVRIRLSNTFGTRPIRLDAVFIGLQNMGKEDGAGLVPRSNHEVTFGGSRSIAIPEGAEALSDPVSFSVGSEQNLAISLFTSGETGPATVHGSAFQTNYVSGPGNFAAEEGANAFAIVPGSKSTGSKTTESKTTESKTTESKTTES